MKLHMLPTDRLIALADAAADLASTEMDRGEYEVANAHLEAAKAYSDAAAKARIAPTYSGSEAAQ